MISKPTLNLGQIPDDMPLSCKSDIWNAPYDYK